MRVLKCVSCGSFFDAKDSERMIEAGSERANTCLHRRRQFGEAVFCRHGGPGDAAATEADCKPCESARASNAQPWRIALQYQCELKKQQN